MRDDRGGRSSGRRRLAAAGQEPDGLAVDARAVAEDDGFDIPEQPPLRQQVYERIEQMIMKGVLQPSERLVETDLARLLKVSRGPVREAFQLLERDGWVEMRPRLGAVVRRRTTREIEELFEVRRTLESRAVEIAAGRLTEAEKRELLSLMAAAEKALADDDIPRLIEANSAVHHFLPTLAGNQAMANLVRAISRRIRWYTLTPQAPRRAPEVLGEHRAIVDALLAGDAEGAAAAMRRHNEVVWKNYTEWLGMPRY